MVVFILILTILIAMAKIAKNLIKSFIHIITDGRDVAPDCAKKYINKFCYLWWRYKIATIAGRYYTMDRDNRWDRVKKRLWCNYICNHQHQTWYFNLFKRFI